MVERLEKRINFALSKIGAEPYVSPKEQIDSLNLGMKEITSPESETETETEKNPFKDELKLFCQYYHDFTCKDNATINVNKNKYECKEILKDYTGNCVNGQSANLQNAKNKLDEFYNELIDKINDKQNTILNIDVKNLEEIQSAYNKYQELQTNMNEHYTDTVLIDNKNYIMNSKLNYSSSTTKLYAFVIVLLVCANIAFYIKMLKNN